MDYWAARYSDILNEVSSMTDIQLLEHAAEYTTTLPNDVRNSLRSLVTDALYEAAREVDNEDF